MANPPTGFPRSIPGVLTSAQRFIDRLGLRPTAVTIRTRTWSGGDIRLGTSSDSDLVLQPSPKVQDRGDGTIEIGPIVPQHPRGGYTVAQLNPLPALSESAAVEVYYIVDGPNGTYRYTLLGIDSRKAFRYTLTLKILERAAPV